MTFYKLISNSKSAGRLSAKYSHGVLFLNEFLKISPTSGAVLHKWTAIQNWKKGIKLLTVLPIFTNAEPSAVGIAPTNWNKAPTQSQKTN